MQRRPIQKRKGKRDRKRENGDDFSEVPCWKGEANFCGLWILKKKQFLIMETGSLLKYSLDSITYPYYFFFLSSSSLLELKTPH